MNHPNHEKMRESLTAFSKLTHVPVTFRNADQKVLWEVSEECKVCCANKGYYDCESQCMRTLSAAMRVADNLGDTYIFLCDSGLTNIIYACEGGYYIAGPIAMGQDRDRVISKFYNMVPVDKINIPVLLSTASKLHIYSPREITYLETGFRDVLKAHLGIDENDVRKLKDTEQAQISSKIIRMKKNHEDIAYPQEDEYVLMNDIMMADEDSLPGDIKEYLEKLMIYDAGDISIVRLRLIVMFTRITQSLKSLEGFDDSILEMESITDCDTMYELAEAVREYAEYIIQRNSHSVYSGKSEIVKKAVEYIHKNYAEGIQLQTIAEELHINKSYLSSLFRNETGINVTEYINDVRLESVANLLKTTNKSITEISFECGFESQSYFSKLFSRKYGCTPREYRKEEG